MKYSTSILALGFAVALAFPAFPQAGKPADKPSTAKEADVTPPPVLGVPPGYRYDSGGRRDPFLNPIPKPETGPEAPVVRPPGLRGLLLAETSINGTVVSPVAGMTRAVIIGPGRKTYFAARGDSLYDAIVKEIRSDAVVFTVISPSTRQPTEQEVVRSVNTSGEKK